MTIFAHFTHISLPPLKNSCLTGPTKNIDLENLHFLFLASMFTNLITFCFSKLTKKQSNFDFSTL